MREAIRLVEYSEQTVLSNWKRLLELKNEKLENRRERPHKKKSSELVISSGPIITVHNSK